MELNRISKAVFHRSPKNELAALVIGSIFATILFAFLKYDHDLMSLPLFFAFCLCVIVSFLILYFKFETFEMTRTGIRHRYLFKFGLLNIIIKWGDIESVKPSTYSLTRNLVITGKGNEWLKRLNIVGANRIDVPMYIVTSKEFVEALERFAPENNVLKKYLHESA